MTKEALLAENQELKRELLLAQQKLYKLQKMQFAKRQERFLSADPKLQPPTLFPLKEDELPKPVVAVKKSEKTPEKKPQRSRPVRKRGQLPKNLKRIEKVLLPDGVDVKELVCIGEDKTEILAMKPAEFYVIVYKRPKFADPTDQSKGVIQAPIPPRTIERGMFDESFLADLTVDKIQFHTPIYRYCRKLKQAGISWMRDSHLRKLFAKVAGALMPMYHLLIKDLLAQPYMQMDETTIKVLSKLKINSSHRGYMWALCSPMINAYAFHYDPGRSGDAACQITEKYNGILQVDGYSAYQYLQRKTGATLAHCMAHARRNFFDAYKGKPPDNHYFLAKCQLLYEFEAIAREKRMTTGQRLQLRQTLALPILEQIKEWLDEQILVKPLLPSLDQTKAIRYALNHWEGLCMYAHDGRIEIDNNLVENSIRPIALGRKNYLFAGSNEAAQNLACLYSIVGTCDRNKINTKAYLEWLLHMVANNKVKDHAIEWLPHRLNKQLRQRFLLK